MQLISSVQSASPLQGLLSIGQRISQHKRALSDKPSQSPHDDQGRNLQYAWSDLLESDVVRESLNCPPHVKTVHAAHQQPKKWSRDAQLCRRNHNGQAKCKLSVRLRSCIKRGFEPLNAQGLVFSLVARPLSSRLSPRVRQRPRCSQQSITLALAHLVIEASEFTQHILASRLCFVDVGFGIEVCD